MEQIKQEIDQLTKGQNKESFQFATKEFPEDADMIFENCEKSFETKYEPYQYQKQAASIIDSIFGIRNGCPPSNLLIASPTGSGKTFAIKWAANRAMENGNKLVISVPLVALAEQVYFELRQLLSGKTFEQEPDMSHYGDDFDYYDDYYDDYSSGINSYVSNNNSFDSDESAVGIRTGPSEKFPDAPIIVCTYEVVLIQMNQNYKFLDNCPLIIIDEIHMISDPGRGHIPENIMNHPNMPYGTKIIGLSGTLPNSMELAEFIGRTNQTETRIIGAKKRPISLDYYIHTSERICDVRERRRKQREKEREKTGKSKEKDTLEYDPEDDNDDIFHKVYNSEEKEFDKAKWEEICTHKKHEYINSNQMKTKIIDLIEDMRLSSKLPAMIVGFSCKRLNTLSTYLDSINLCENKKCSSMVHIEFNRLRKRVPEEEWGLFVRFMELAKRGIAVHHSQNPKHYLEIVPKLVKKGYIKVIFATSSLSAGIDLPVRTVVITDLKMPTKKGFRQIETNLFHQICGRAGRPGLETQGNVVIVKWKKQEVDVHDLITTPPVPVVSQYKLTPSTILNLLSKDDPDSKINRLVLQSFATKSTHRISAVIVKCMKFIKEKTTDNIQRIIDAMNLLEEIRSNADFYISHCWKEMTKKCKVGKIVYAEPEKGLLKPVRTTIRKVDGNVLQTDHGEVKTSWVFCIEGAKFKKMKFDVFNVYKSVQADISKLRDMELEYTDEEFNQAKEVCHIKWQMQELKRQVSPEATYLWDDYQKQIEILKKNGFVSKAETLLTKGKMAAGVLSPDDPLTMIEFLTQNDYDENDIIPLLTCFLRQKKNNEPMGSADFTKIVKLQKNIWTLKNETLGSSMMKPMRMWMNGHSVLDIVENTDISAGHFCKEALRMKELLTQVADACAKVGNFELEKLMTEKNQKLQRGLPFLQSSFLK